MWQETLDSIKKYYEPSLPAGRMWWLREAKKYAGVWQREQAEVVIPKKIMAAAFLCDRVRRIRRALEEKVSRETAVPPITEVPLYIAQEAIHAYRRHVYKRNSRYDVRA